MTECRHREEADPQGRTALTLEAEELFVLGALRSWIAAQRGAGGPGWRELFALAGLTPTAAVAFGGFMEQVRRGLRRSLDIRCCPCPQVGRDEEALFRIIGAVQRNDRLGAIEDLADWLDPAAVMPGLAAATRAAEALAAEAVLLPAAAAMARSGHGAAWSAVAAIRH